MILNNFITKPVFLQISLFILPMMYRIILLFLALSAIQRSYDRANAKNKTSRRKPYFMRFIV
jgi:hypothetical protein